MIVLMTVPGRSMIPTTYDTALVMVRDVIVIMTVNLRRMRMLRLFAVILNPLLLRHDLHLRSIAQRRRECAKSISGNVGESSTRS
jgi:signal peptidase I